MEDFAEIAWRLVILLHMGLGEKLQAFGFEELTRLAMTNSPISFDTTVANFATVAANYQNYMPFLLCLYQ